MKLDTYLNKVKMVKKSMEMTEQTVQSDDAKIAFDMFDTGALKMIKALAVDDPDITIDNYITLTIEISKVEKRK